MPRRAHASNRVVPLACRRSRGQDDPQAMLDFALRLRQEGDPGAVEWLRATGRKGHPLACMQRGFQAEGGETQWNTHADPNYQSF